MRARRARGAAWRAAAASVLLTACGGAPADSPALTRGAILGGAPDADHPAVVGITATHGDGSVGICSGTVIFVEDRSALVLTAAHCVVELDAARDVKTPVVALAASSLDVTAGGFIAQDRMLGRTFHAVALSVAPGYDGFIGSPDDVAIVRIVGATAALPRLTALTAAQDQLQAGAAVTLVGFGDAEMPDSAGLRRATQKVVAWLNPQFIGFDQTDGHGVCEGDSGGPVLVSVDGAAAVAGVTSFVRGAAKSPCGGGSTTIRVGAHAAFIARAAQAIPLTLDCASCTLAELAPGNACGPGTDCTGACADHLRCMDACTDLPCLVNCQTTPEASAYASQLENNLSCAAERCAAVCAAEAAGPADGGIGGDGGTHGGAVDGGTAAAAAGGCAISPAGRARHSAGAWALVLIAAACGRRRRRGRMSSLALALGAVSALVLVGSCGSVTLKPSEKDAGGDGGAGTRDSTDGGDDGAGGRSLPTIALSSPTATLEIGGFYADPTTDDLCPTGSVVIGYDAATTQDPSSDVVDRIRTVCGALIVSRSTPLEIEVGASTALQGRGSGPGLSIPLPCPTNQVVIGFEGRSGAFVDQLTFQCAPLFISSSENGVAVGAISARVSVGGIGGSPQGSFDCGPGSVAVGTRTLADGVLKKIALLCASVTLRP